MVIVRFLQSSYGDTKKKLVLLNGSKSLRTPFKAVTYNSDRKNTVKA